MNLPRGYILALSTALGICPGLGNLSALPMCTSLLAAQQMSKCSSHVIFAKVPLIQRATDHFEHHELFLNPPLSAPHTKTPPEQQKHRRPREPEVANMGIPFDYAPDRPEHIDAILNGLDRYNPETTAIFQEYVTQQCEDRTVDVYANLALLKL